MTIHSTHPDFSTRIHSNVLLIKAGYDVDDPSAIELAFQNEPFKFEKFDMFEFDEHLKYIKSCEDKLNILDYYHDAFFAKHEVSNYLRNKMADYSLAFLINCVTVFLALTAIVANAPSKKHTFNPISEMKALCFSFDTLKSYRFSPGSEYMFNGKNYRCEQVANFYQWIPIDGKANN